LIIKNTDYIKANAFAFYSINGRNLIDFMESSKAENVCEFLEKIVEQNSGKRIICEFLEKIVEQNSGERIILVLDNSRAHHADKTVRKARELNITLVFLPPYSPDLNPVEFVWKAIKREVSVRFIQSKEQLKKIIKNEFMKVENSLSFAKKWMEKFNPQIKSVIC
jgi:transposase